MESIISDNILKLFLDYIPIYISDLNAVGDWVTCEVVWEVYCCRKNQQMTLRGVKVTPVGGEIHIVSITSRFKNVLLCRN